MNPKNQKTALKMLSLIAVVLLVFMGITLIMIDNESKLQKSNVAMYMADGEDNVEYAQAYEDGTVYFNLSLENYIPGDSEDRYVLLYVDEDAIQGDSARWSFKFLNPIDGEDTANFSYKGIDYYAYLVDSDSANPTTVQIEVNHLYNQEEDNQDRIAYTIRGFDYEANTAPPWQNNWTKFLMNMTDELWGNPDGDVHSNLTYLQDKPNTPSIRDEEFPEEEITLNARIIANPYDPDISALDSIVITPGEVYPFTATVRNEGQQTDQIKFTAKLDHSNEGYWTIEATNYVFEDDISLVTEGSQPIYLEITAPVDFDDVPAGEYDLILTATSKDPRFKDIHTVNIVVPQRYDPLLTVVGEDDKNAATDGTNTTFDLRLRNDGSLDESFDMFAEVQDRTARAAGDTDDFWYKAFSLDPVRVNADGTIEFTVNLKPELDNEKIAPGKYPVRLVATSQNNTAQYSETEIIVRMPNLYNPEAAVDSAPPSIQVGATGSYLFTLTNNGVVEDIMSLDFTIKVGEDIFTSTSPGDWGFEFRDAETSQTINAPYQVTLGTTPETKSKSIYLLITPPQGTLVDDYELTIIAKSEGPVDDLIMNDWNGVPLVITVVLPDLFIDTADISFNNDKVKEGDSVTITATVHLDGSIGTTSVKVGFFYHTAAQGFVSIGTEDLDFGGAADTTQNVEFVWASAKVPQLDKDNIRVVVDTNSDVLEDNEDNNAATASLTVEAEDDGTETPWVPIVAGVAIATIGGIILLAWLGIIPILFAGKSEFIVAELTMNPEIPKAGQEVELKAILLNEGGTLEAGEQTVTVSFFEGFDPIEELDVSETSFEKGEETELPVVKWTPKEGGDKTITVVLEVDGDEEDEFSLEDVTVETA